LDGKAEARNRKVWRRLGEGEDTAQRQTEATMKIKTKKETKKNMTYYLTKNL